MKPLNRRDALGLLGAAVLPGLALGQSWPGGGPVRLVVPFAAGGPADTLARVIAERLQPRLGAPVIVENVGGAGATLGMTRVAQANADGYTLGYGTSASHVISPLLYSKVAYDPLKGFTPISLVAEHVNVLVVAAASRFRSVADILRAAKSAPGRVTYASAGVGSTNHLSGELLAQAAGVTLTHVPYKGSGPAIIDVAAGTVDFMFDVPLTAMPLVHSGKLRALATTLSDKTRHASVPSLPTVSETLPGFEVLGWTAFFGPAGLPPAIVARLNKELATILGDPQTRERFARQGFDTVPSTPEGLVDRIQRDRAMWGPLIKSANVRVE